MGYKRLALIRCVGVVLCVFVSVSAWGVDYKEVVLDSSYAHDKWGTEPRDEFREFRAYATSFDSADDDDGDGVDDVLGIPEWVAHEIKGMENAPTSGPARPSTWITDSVFRALGIAPHDDSYRGSGYDRGHMCQKLIATRLGDNADWNTHTFLNACPQEADFNRGIWLDLEKKTAKWADAFGAVWVVCGPVFWGGKARMWIGDDDELPVAVPDAFFKLVIRESDGAGGVDVLAFLYPQHRYPRKSPYDHTPFLVSVDFIESITGLDFLTTLGSDDQDAVEAEAATELW